MTKDKKITKVFVPIFCSVITLIGGFWGGKTYETHQNSAININIMNTLSDGSTEVNADTDLKTSTTNLIDAYMNEKDENQSQLQQIDSLKNDNNQAKKELETFQTANEKLQLENSALQAKSKNLQKENENLKTENVNLKTENEKVKAILLHDNTYAENIDDIVIVNGTFDHLENLDVNDCHRYDQVDAVKDYHGDYHSVSYRLHADDTAFVEYKLAKKYDLINANIITTLETGPNVQFNLEVYIDDQFLKRIDAITQDSSLIPLGPIVITNVDRLRIKVIKMEGDYNNKAICYITDDELSIVQ